MNKYHNISLPSCRVRMSLYYRAFGVFSLLILVKIHHFSVLVKKNQCLGDHEIVINGLKIDKNEESQKYLSSIL